MGPPFLLGEGNLGFFGFLGFLRSIAPVEISLYGRTLPYLSAGHYARLREVFALLPAPYGAIGTAEERDQVGHRKVVFSKFGHDCLPVRKAMDKGWLGGRIEPPRPER